VIGITATGRNQAMSTDTHEPTKTTEATFTADEAKALEMLQNRYQTDHDLFSPRELAHLRFLRWRVVTGRLWTDLDTTHYSARENAA
jgi:hypothetical protein